MSEPHPQILKTCPKCQAKFECGIARGEESCWCFNLPHVLPIVDNAACLCPECLQKEIAAKSLDSKGTDCSVS